MHRGVALFVVAALVASPAAAAKKKPRVEGLRIYAVPSDSMQPLLRSGDRVLVDEEAYVVAAPSRGDVVVYRSPAPDGGTLLKRIVGIPQDTIEFRSGQLFVNGNAAVEPYETAAVRPPPAPATSTTATVAMATAAPEGWRATIAPMTLQPAEYYLLSDNRAFSSINDSRTHGPVMRGMIHGRVLRGSRDGKVYEVR